MNWAREDLAWVAGVHCGEGSVTQLRGNKNAPDWRGAMWKITQACAAGTEECPEMLLRVKRIFGFGNIYKNKRAKENCRPTWTYSTGKFESVQAAVAAMWAWLTPEKKDQAERVLREHLTCKVHSRWGRYSSEHARQNAIRRKTNALSI